MIDPRVQGAVVGERSDAERLFLLTGGTFLRETPASWGRMRNYPVDVQVPIAGIIRGPWQETVTEQDERGNPRINRHAYEMCVLLAVRERLRSKELWVSGANRIDDCEPDCEEPE